MKSIGGKDGRRVGAVYGTLPLSSPPPLSNTSQANNRVEPANPGWNLLRRLGISGALLFITVAFLLIVFSHVPSQADYEANNQQDHSPSLSKSAAASLMARDKAPNGPKDSDEHFPRRQRLHSAEWPALPWYPYPSSATNVLKNPWNVQEGVVRETFVGFLKVCEFNDPQYVNGQRIYYQAGEMSLEDVDINPGGGVPNPMSTSCNNKPSSIGVPYKPSHNITTLLTDTQAPLIRMVPGNRYILVLINDSTHPTNLHTHGLHVSGVGQVDDITRTVSPQSCLVFHYVIRDDADVGTFWYHSHRHPLAADQVGHGAYGPLIVEEKPSTLQQHYPVTLARFLTQQEILVQYASVLNKNTMIRTNAINQYMERSLPESFFLPRTEKGKGKSRNETHSIIELPPLLNLQLRRDEWYYLRLSFVILSEPVSFVKVDPLEACEVRVVAYDGVYRSEIPSPWTLDEDDGSGHMMTVSSRVDWAVRCSAETADLHFYQEGHVLSNATRLVSIQTYVSKKDEHSTFHSSPSPYWDASTQSTWKPRRPYYMQDLIKFQQIDDYWNVSMNELRFLDDSKILWINEDQWDPSKPIRNVPIGQLAEWDLQLTSGHPFHIHINRMQIVEPGGCGYRYEYGEYFDSVASQHNTCRIRIHFQDYAGRVVAHCHKLKHEDQGMMVWFNVTDGPGEGVLGITEESCLSPTLLLPNKHSPTTTRQNENSLH